VVKTQAKKDPALRTKPQLAVDLVERARSLGVPFHAVVADSVYGESAACEGALWGTGRSADHGRVRLDG